jgi:hypothetical protein
MKVELKPHRWREAGRNMRADFFPFVDGEPRHDINHCQYCVYDNGTGECEKAKIVKKDDEKLYLFCGSICGYFQIKEELDESI